MVETIAQQTVRI